MNGRIVVQGGAGKWTVEESAGLKAVKVLKEAAEAGSSALRTGSAVDGVVAAVRVMEESGVLNAGRGAYPNYEGILELDAGIMDGERLLAGGVGAVRDVPHPVELARIVMERTAHVLLVAGGAEKLAEAYGLREKLAPTKERLEAFDKGWRSYVHSPQTEWLRRLDRNYLRAAEPGDTVGAVALDQDGRLAAATSTGGTPFKLPGRVGDSPLAGAGFYAMGSVGAASATGTGEVIIKHSLSMKAVELMAAKETASAAAKMAVIDMGRLYGDDTGGIITLDKTGNAGLYANTQAIAVGFSGAGLDPYAKIVYRGDLESFRRALSRRM
ncbi:MAG TPA: isoaspartyl peptidase/L-asparaginase [Conexivisphaerales archaeon]|nr:isoaspartyl peptidase/L-asparaginase [Conexivisphaerales archaeon]